MPSYDFEVWQGDGALHTVKGVELERPAHAWDRVAKLARRFSMPGCRIVVKDERGGIAILIGARTAQQLFSPRRASHSSGTPRPAQRRTNSAGLAAGFGDLVMQKAYGSGAASGVA